MFRMQVKDAPASVRTTLFRQESMRRDSLGVIGRISVIPPRIGWQALWFVTLLIGGLIAISIFATYTSREKVQGHVVYQSAAISISSARAGTIRRFLVHEGGEVHAGEVIAELSTDVTTKQGNARETVLATISDRSSSLASDNDSEDAQYAKSREALHRQQDGLRQKSGFVEKQVVYQTERAKSAQGLYQRWASLGKDGIVSTQQLIQQKDVALQAQGELERLQAEKADIGLSLAKLEASVTELETSHSLKRSENERKRSELEASAAEARIDETIFVRSSVDGTMTGIASRPGESVSAGAILATVVPLSSPFMVELRIPNDQSALVETGQEVRIQYDGFSQVRFGTHRGEILEMTKATVATGGGDRGKPSYRALVRLDDQDIRISGKVYHLKNGMSLSAEIFLDKRPFYEWFFGVERRGAEKRS